MEVKIVLGYTFGDEGKGVTTQWLCKKAIEEGKKPLVIRFSGGPQAAHTVNNNGIEHICSTFGSGVLLGVPTHLFDNCFIDPISFMREYKSLEEKGIKPSISCSMFNRIITPYDVFAGIRDDKVMSDGTCGKGIYPTFKRYKDKMTTYFTSAILGYEGASKRILEQARDCYPLGLYDQKVEEEFNQSYKEMIKIMTIRDDYFDAKNFDVLIFEGSQGLLLDMDNGFFPHVTPSKVGLNGIEERFLQDAEVYLVTRTYSTRHGNGPSPSYPLEIDLSGKHETNVNNEFQGEFKVGILETSLLNKATERHTLDNYAAKYGCKFNLVVTHMDVSIEAGIFDWEVGGYHNCIVGKMSPENILFQIVKNLKMSFSNIYYNDSIESNIKQCHETKNI